MLEVWHLNSHLHTSCFFVSLTPASHILECSLGQLSHWFILSTYPNVCQFYQLHTQTLHTNVNPKSPKNDDPTKNITHQYFHCLKLTIAKDKKFTFSQGEKTTYTMKRELYTKNENSRDKKYDFCKKNTKNTPK